MKVNKPESLTELISNYSVITSPTMTSYNDLPCAASPAGHPPSEA